MASSGELKLLEVAHVLPAAGGFRPTTLPLTFFDVLYHRFRPVQRLFLFQLPSPFSTPTFLGTILPDLKNSLSKALEIYHPLAGHLLCPNPYGEQPCISYTDGDSVTLTVVESMDDFTQLTDNSPLLSFRLHRLVPGLPEKDQQPIISFQLTLFPSHGGLGLGIATHHGAIDGVTSMHFLRTWASIHRSGALPDDLPVPIFDRSCVGDPNGLLQSYLAQWATRKLQFPDVTGRPDVVRMAFPFTAAQLDSLRQYAQGVSAFAAACGVAWASMVRARWGADPSGKEELERFHFLSDCRGRGSGAMVAVPGGYFGNCVALCGAEARRGELVQEEGWVAAARAVWGKVEALRRGEALRGAEGWVSAAMGLATKAGFSVSGSPRHGVYDRVDFGWGRARRVEVVSVETRSAMCMAENRDEKEGGFEIGIGLPPPLMEAFAANLAHVLRTFS